MSLHLSRWIRIALVAALVALTAGVGFYAFRYFSRPITLTVATGSIDGESVKLMSAIASRLASSTTTRIRLKVVDKGTALAASHAFSAGEVDLAVVRGDIGDLSAARAVVVVSHAVVMVIGLPGNALGSIDDLKGKTVGVVGGEVNHNLVRILDKEYELSRTKVRFKDIAIADVPSEILNKQVQALLVVMPITDKYLTRLRGFFPRDVKRAPSLLPIESAGAIATVAQAYESYDIPKGTIRGSPPIPDDDLTTLRVPFYLVAKEKLDEDSVAELTKAVMEMRGSLIGEHPILAQITAPSTEKDAAIAIHPGAAAYFGGEVKTIFDKYGDQFFYASMLVGMLSSIAAAIWKFMLPDATATDGRPPERLYKIIARIRHAGSDAELDQIEEEIDNILRIELSRAEPDNADAAALNLALSRLEHLINQRRRILDTGKFRSQPAQ
jgi:TRAP transporter TAXI family solute receptor